MTSDEKFAKVVEIFNQYTHDLGAYTSAVATNFGVSSDQVNSERRALAEAALKKIGSLIADDDGRRFESHG